MSNKEIAMWIECIATDKRVPKDVREMCKDIVFQLLKKKIKGGE